MRENKFTDVSETVQALPVIFKVQENSQFKTCLNEIIFLKI